MLERKKESVCLCVCVFVGGDCMSLSCTSWHKFIFSRNLLNDSGAEQQASGCVYGMERWAAVGEKSQGAPSLSGVLSAVFKLCRHPAPVWTKPAKTTEQKIPSVFDWTDTNAMFKVIQVCRMTSRKSPKTCTAGRLEALHSTWVVVTRNGDLSRVYPCDPY